MTTFAPLVNTFMDEVKIVDNPSCSGGSGHAMTSIIREDELTP